MPVVHLRTEIDYESILTKNIAVVHFFAEWLEQCEHMNNVLEELATKDEFKDVLFAKLLAEQVPQVTLKHNVTAVPTFIIIVDGNEAARVNGASPNRLISKLTNLIQSNKSSSNIDKKITENISSAQPEGKDLKLDERLKTLISAAPVMLFMKGNADQPRCGFSKEMVNILKQHNVEFKTFDILNDPEVREGLKKFSDWPTYPQLYINGELIGGLDMAKELLETGELQEKFSSKPSSIEERLKSLISKSKVMVFMKGNRLQPRCGFSRQLIEILNNTGSKYETFDILGDEEVRQGLKEYSSWPTYPQVYVNGEFVGGLDIIKDHVENGELSNVLNIV